MKTKLFLLAALLLCHPASASAQGGARAASTAERKSVLAALRAPVEKQLKQKVVFKVDHLKVSGDWAFMRGAPRRPDGGAVDYRGTVHQQAIEDGVFDDWVCALLKRRGGAWRVVEFAVGATDVVYEGWDRKHKAPPSVFR